MDFPEWSITIVSADTRERTNFSPNARTVLWATVGPSSGISQRVSLGLMNQGAVDVVFAKPEPDVQSRFFESQRSILKRVPSGPDFPAFPNANFPKLQRLMIWIAFFNKSKSLNGAERMSSGKTLSEVRFRNR